MKLKANDTLHISAVKADNILPNEEFEVSEAEGKRLIAAGYAREVKPAAKKAAAPANKKAPEAKNKAAASAKAK